MTFNRRQTRHAQWSNVWGQLEELSLPVDSGQVKDWHDRYGTDDGKELLTALDGLQNKDELSMDGLELLRAAIKAAFQAGRDFDGRTSKP